MFLTRRPPVPNYHKDDQTGRRIQGGHAGRISEPEKEIHQDRDGQDKYPTNFQDVDHNRQVCFVQSAQAKAPRDGINLDEQHQKIQQRRNGRRNYDILIGNFEKFRDDKGRRPHHRWRNLAAIRGDGFDCASVFWLETGLLHKRYSDDTCRHYITDGRPGDRAERA